MRTAVEISDELRARLLEIAARRGEKGFSRLIEEALARFLNEEDARILRLEAALGTIGSLSDSDIASLEETSRDLRSRWR